jgi:hypothetical protein
MANIDNLNIWSDPQNDALYHAYEVVMEAEVSRQSDNGAFCHRLPLGKNFPGNPKVICRR